MDLFIYSLIFFGEFSYLNIPENVEELFFLIDSVKTRRLKLSDY